MTLETTSNEYIDRESGREMQDPPPIGPGRQRAWAIRRYFGIGPGGEVIEEWTAPEIAERLDVSDRTIRRWCNEEPLPLVEEWSQRERLTLFACVISGDRETLEEYLVIQRLLEQSESPNSEAAPPRITSAESASTSENPHPFDGFDDDFSPW